MKTKSLARTPRGWSIPVILAIALLLLLDQISFTDFGAAVFSPSGVTFFSRLAVSAVLIAYSLFFSLLILAALFGLYHLISACRQRRSGGRSVDRGRVIFPAVLLALYLAWIGGERIRAIPALAGGLAILWSGFLAAGLVLLVVRVRRSADPGDLPGAGLAGLGGLLIFRLVFSVLDAAFFTPLTAGRLPLAAGGLAISLSAGLAGYRGLKKYFRLERRGEKYLRSVIRAAAALVFIVAAAALAGLFRESREAFPPAPSPVPSTPEKTNVILIVIDALRADHLSVYGYPRPTTPRLDRLARDGVRFEQCYTVASWTKPAVASLLTGLYPAVHGAVGQGDRLPAAAVTLAQLLRERGYLTAGVVANPHLKREMGFARGFDLYDDFLVRYRLYEIALRPSPLFPLLAAATGKNFDLTDRDNAVRVNRRVFHYLDRLAKGPFFLYIHYMDPHAPYLPPRGYRNLFPAPAGDEAARIASLYDAEIRFVDAEIGKLLDHLRDRGLADRTLVVVTADHGEALGEGGDFGHGHTIRQEQLLVPLILRHPDLSPGRVISPPARLIDIPPTILDLLSLPPGGKIDGRSLSPRLEGGETPVLVEDIFLDHENFNRSFVIRGVIAAGRWKYIRTERSLFPEQVGREELYDLAADPGETYDLSAELPDLRDELREKHRRHWEAAEDRKLPASPATLDSETVRQIRALGYM